MKLKKIFAAVLAGAVALSSFSLSAFAASSEGDAAAKEPVEVVLFDAADAPKGDECGSNGKVYKVTAAQLSDWGVTAEDIASCSVGVKYAETPVELTVGINVNGEDGEINWINGNFVYNSTDEGQTPLTVTDKASTSPLSAIGEKAATAIANGISIQVKSAIVTGVTFNKGSTENDVYKYEVGVMDTLAFSSAAMSELDSASKLTVTVDGEGSGTFSLQETSTWGGVWDKTSPAVITGADLSSIQDKSGVQVVFKNFTKINKVTLKFEYPAEGDEEGPGSEATTATLTVNDASWADDFSKAAQANIVALPEGFVVGETTYADVKNKIVTFKGVTLSNLSLEGAEISDISVSLYSQWGDDDKWKANYTNTWDLSGITGVEDTDVLKGFGFQLNINGNVGDIDDMELGSTAITVDYVNKGFTVEGGEEPGAVTTKNVTLEGVNASSWGEAGVTKAAQLTQTMTPAGFRPGTTTYGNVKNTTVTFDGITVKSVTGAGLTVEDVEVVLYAQWGSSWEYWTTGSVDGWDLSTIEDLPDSAVLQGFGYQLTIKGNVGGINDMELADISVPVVIEYVGLTVDGEINNDTPADDTPTESNPDNWQIVIYGFGSDWKAGWHGTKGAKGQFTLETTMGAVMETDEVTGWIGGFQVQVWGANPNDLVSYKIIVKSADGMYNKLGVSGIHTITASEDDGKLLGQYCTNVCWGDYVFDRDDVITVVIAEGEATPSLPSSGGTGSAVSGGSSGTTTPSTPDDNNNEVIDPETLPVKFTDTENETGVEVAAPEDAFDAADEVKFNAEPIAEETDDKDTFTFDFNFTDKDGNEVQPKAAVTVSVPVPTALTGKTVFVYHIENDGKYTEVNCKIENGKILFTVSSFSKYVITSQKLSANGEPVTNDQPGTTNPGTSNPSTGVAGVTAVLSITAIAAGALIVSKKRK